MPDEVMRSYEFGVFRFDVRERMLACNGQPVPLTPKAADLLLVLLQNRGDLVWSALTISRAWFADGRPKAKASLGSFESWASGMGT